MKAFRFLTGLCWILLQACASAPEDGDKGGAAGVSAGTFASFAGTFGSAGQNGLPLAGTAGTGASEPVAGTAAGMPPILEAGAVAPPLAGMVAPPLAGMVAPPLAGMVAPPVAGMVAPPVMDDLPPAGPDDGDPGAPVVTAAGVPCGPNPSLFGLTSTNVTIGGRGVHVAYPCNKRKGAPVVFVLQLHGTMPAEELKLYQVAYFAVNNHANTHNIITAAPKAIGSQWGNGDGGKDLPHIMEVIDWVYTTFKDFDIRAMWVSGHSWGAMYSTTFACRAELANKVRGVVLQSGSGMNPACASRISVISSAAQTDIGPVINQGVVPTSHGCGAPQTNMLGNNTETYWPNCNPGFAHANYLMLGKGHSDYMDAVVVSRIADLIKGARP
jgi:hypothetical protein